MPQIPWRKAKRENVQKIIPINKKITILQNFFLVRLPGGGKASLHNETEKGSFRILTSTLLSMQGILLFTARQRTKANHFHISKRLSGGRCFFWNIRHCSAEIVIVDVQLLLVEVFEDYCKQQGFSTRLLKAFCPEDLTWILNKTSFVETSLISCSLARLDWRWVFHITSFLYRAEIFFYHENFSLK